MQDGTPYASGTIDDSKKGKVTYEKSQEVKEFEYEDKTIYWVNRDSGDKWTKDNDYDFK